jgi:hypothetical protein
VKYINEKKLYEVKPDKAYLKHIFMRNMYYSFFAGIIVVYFYIYMLANSIVTDRLDNILIINLMLISMILVTIYVCISITKKEYSNIKYIITNNRIIFEYGFLETKMESFFYEELIDVDVENNIDDLYTLVFIKKSNNQDNIRKKDVLKMRYIKNADRLVEILEENMGGGIYE